MRITDNTQAVQFQIESKAGIFLRLMEDQIISIADPITPKRSGDLRRRVLKQVSGLKGKLIWGTGYGIFQELKQFRNYTTPGTGPNFARKGAEGGVSRTLQVAKKAGLV